MAEGKWIAGLDPHMRATEAACVVLAARLDTVRHYLPLAAKAADENIEYVHQLRVGTRRAGAALRAFASFLPAKHLHTTKARLRVLRQAAGDARDWDVLLEMMSSNTSSAVPSSQPALDFLRGYAACERVAAQSRLVDAFEDVGAAFASSSALMPGRVRGRRGKPQTLGDVASEVILLCLGRFQETLDARPESAPELHALRIRGKRLRYAIELFAECFEASLRETIYPAVEDVQEILGEMQDATVAAARFHTLHATAQRVSGPDWPRLEPGFRALEVEQEEKWPRGWERFRSWVKRWTELMQSHAPESLQISAKSA